MQLVKGTNMKEKGQVISSQIETILLPIIIANFGLLYLVTSIEENISKEKN